MPVVLRGSVRIPDDVEADLLPVPILWFQERDPRKDIMLLYSSVVTRKFIPRIFPISAEPTDFLQRA